MPEDAVEFLTTVMRDFSKDHNLRSWHRGEDTPTIYSKFSYILILTQYSKCHRGGNRVL